MLLPAPVRAMAGAFQQLEMSTRVGFPTIWRRCVMSEMSYADRQATGCKIPIRDGKDHGCNVKCHECSVSCQ